MPSARTVAFQLLIVAALLLLVEVTARVAYTLYVPFAKQPDWFTYTADLGWDRRPGFSGVDECKVPRTFDGHGLLASDGERIRQRKDGQLRALFLGDSNTYGYCLWSDDAFVAVANNLVPQAVFANLGVNGFTSHQGYKALLKYGDLIAPDFVFISFNFNDRRLVMQPELADSDATFRRLYSSSRVQRASEFSYLFWLASAAGNKLSATGAAPYSVGWMDPADVRLDKVRPRVDPRSYRDNLTRMAQWARQRGATPVFILLGDNPKETASLREGVKLLSEGNIAKAIERLAAAENESKGRWFAGLARLYASQAYKAAGQADKADEVLSLQSAIVGLTGGIPIILDTDYHKIMREVAAEQGAPLIDAASELAKYPDVFIDFCHFNEGGHELVGKLIAKTIEATKR